MGLSYLRNKSSGILAHESTDSSMKGNSQVGGAAATSIGARPGSDHEHPAHMDMTLIFSTFVVLQGLNKTPCHPEDQRAELQR